jgi:osmotically-inducible protein OsmY
MARRRSQEDVTEARRRGLLNSSRQRSREAERSHGAQNRRDLPDDGDLRWQRRELEAGWRHPHYEGFYDESAARERAPSASAECYASEKQARDHSQRSWNAFWAIGGPESGNGPKGYRRSDERLLEDVCERLTRHGWLDASGIKVSCERGEIVLRGRVNNRDARRLAEACAHSVSGVQQVQNKLKLRTFDRKTGPKRTP